MLTHYLRTHVLYGDEEVRQDGSDGPFKRKEKPDGMQRNAAEGEATTAG